MITLSLPGLDTDLRIPVLALPKDFFLKDQSTYDQVMQIIAWSFDNLLLGEHPRCRHDGQGWKKSDVSRKKKGGDSLQKAVLTEVRGDWAFYKHQLRLPGWNEKDGCCWKCNMTRDRIDEVHSQAFWKEPANRLVHTDVMHRIFLKNKTVSPLFSVPYCTVDLCMIDWLHAVDLGVCPDFLGSLFTLFLSVLPGANATQKCNELYSMITRYYRENQCSSKLDRLTPTMLKKEKAKVPKLRAKAGEARDLVGFAKEAADSLLGKSDEHAAAKSCASSLLDCYQLLSADHFNRQQLSAAATKFALQYSGLNAYAKAHGLRRWALKPKFHIFLELCHTAESSPAKFWTYRDESFGGFVSGMCSRRGGALTPIAVGQSFLDRFAAMHAVPSF